MKNTPFYLNTGQHPWTGKEFATPSNNNRAQDFADQIKSAQKDTGVALNKAAEAMAHAHNKKKLSSRNYNPGDKVWLEATNIKTTWPSKKLDAKRFGPFTIVKKVGRSTYKLNLPATWRIHDIFNESYLSPFWAPAFPSKDTPPHCRLIWLMDKRSLK
jgi:hypothetical protein